MARDRELTALQRAFCVALARNPSNATEAARIAGYQGGQKALSVVSTRLKKDPRVQAELTRLRGEQNALTTAALGDALTRIDAIRTLSTLARDGTQPIGGRVRAIRELGLLEGWYQHGNGEGGPPEVHVHGGGQAVIVWRGNGRGPEPSSG